MHLSRTRYGLPDSGHPGIVGFSMDRAASTELGMTVDLEVKRAYVETLQFIVEQGRAPHFTELSTILRVGVERALELQRAAAQAGIGSWFLSDTDFVECWAPFSSIPTNHLISIDGEQRWYGQCGLEALAATWVVPDRDVRVDSFCLDCGDTVTVMQRNGELLDVDPVAAVGHMNKPLSSADWDKRASFL